jgi:hypothetical protein
MPPSKRCALSSSPLAAIVAATLLTFALQSAAQTAAHDNTVPPPDPTPSTAYNNILTPFSQTREDMRNWSQIEVDAFTRASTEAGAACSRLEKTPFEGEELFTLARLCALGQNWPGAYSASLRYTYALPAPHLVDDYTILCQADLNTNNVQEIPSRLQQLTSAAPFTPEINQLFIQMLDVTQFTSPKVAVTIALLLEPHLLHALSTPDPKLPAALLENESWKILILLHRNQRTSDEQAFSAQLKTTLATAPTTALPILQQTWYNLLGQRLPPTLRSILPHNPTHTKQLLIVSAAPLQENSSLYRSLQTLQTQQRIVASHISVVTVGAAIPGNLHLRYTNLAPSNDAITHTLSSPQGPVFLEITPTYEILSITQGDPAWLDSTPIVNALLASPSAWN